MALNQYPFWKNCVIVLVLAVGLLYALPNVFGEDPAVQISTKNNAAVQEAVLQEVKQSLDSHKVEPKSIEIMDGNLIVRLKKADDQLETKAFLQDLLGKNYIVALNLAPATPAWLREIGAYPMKLGLDLRGGVHFLMEVDVDAAIAHREKTFVAEMRTSLRKAKIRYNGIRVSKTQGLIVRFKDSEVQNKAFYHLRKEFQDLTFTKEVESGRPVIQGHLSPEGEKLIRDHAIEQTMTTLRNRVNELGVAEAVVQRQGANRIVVQLPGVQDTAQAKEIIGKTASVEFLLVDTSVDPLSVANGQVPPGARVISDQNGREHVFGNQVILSGETIVGAQSGFDERGQPNVSVRVGGNTAFFSKVTRENIGKPMGTIFIETKFEDKMVKGEKKRVKRTTETAISIATINSGLGNRFQITGLGSSYEASNLALLLRAGSLPAPVDIIEERTIGPSLGQENINMGMNSVMGGLLAVLVFMAIYYRGFGLIANIALVVNLVLLVAVMSLIQVTLTLPGIAGIVLTLGMAVDASVLIFERIREEIRNKTTPQASINAGFEKAFVTIMDANITTFIAAVVLFSIGTGPIKGFAVTLTIGLMTSVFTAVMVSRGIVNLCYGNRNIKKLSIGI